MDLGVIIPDAVEEAATRYLLAFGLVERNPGDMFAICARDGALHDLAHALDVPCPLCRDDLPRTEDTPPL